MPATPHYRHARTSIRASAFSGAKKMAGTSPGHDEQGAMMRSVLRYAVFYEHPLVFPQVSHFMQVPFRTMVKLPHSSQDSPS